MLYIGNVTARALRNPEDIAADLANNIAHGVRWYESMIVLQELGCTLFIETPPGHVLTNLAKQSVPDAKSIALADSSLSYVSPTGSPARRMSAYGRMGVWAYGRIGVSAYGRMGVWACRRLAYRRSAFAVSAHRPGPGGIASPRSVVTEAEHLS